MNVLSVKKKKERQERSKPENHRESFVVLGPPASGLLTACLASRSGLWLDRSVAQTLQLRLSVLPFLQGSGRGEPGTKLPGGMPDLMPPSRRPSVSGKATKTKRAEKLRAGGGREGGVKG